MYQEPIYCEALSCQLSMRHGGRVASEDPPTPEYNTISALTNFYAI